MKLTLRNNFHSTCVTVISPVLNHGVHLETQLTRYQLARVNRLLCGVEGCVCGGIRGPQAVGGKRLIVCQFPKD